MFRLTIRDMLRLTVVGLRKNSDWFEFTAADIAAFKRREIMWTTRASDLMPAYSQHGHDTTTASPF